RRCRGGEIHALAPYFSARRRLEVRLDVSGILAEPPDVGSEREEVLRLVRATAHCNDQQVRSQYPVGAEISGQVLIGNARGGHEYSRVPWHRRDRGPAALEDDQPGAALHGAHAG